MPLQFTVLAEIPTTPESVYNAWLNGEQHAAMTDAPATGTTTVGSTFTAHGGYITGKNVELAPFSKIVQRWRTTEFEDDDEDSILTITFEALGNNTLVTLAHANLPPHGSQYEEGWKAYYFKPMKAYFSPSK
jgi:uncharacterized protein YndB with AHSA1/START domain